MSQPGGMTHLLHYSSPILFVSRNYEAHWLRMKQCACVKFICIVLPPLTTSHLQTG